MAVYVIEGGEAYPAIAGRAEFTAVDDHPFYGGFGRLYYPAVIGNAASNASMTVFVDDTPVLYVPATIVDGLLGYNGMALRFFFASSSDLRTREAAVDVLFRHIDAALASGRATRAWVRDETAAGTLGPIGVAALNRSASISLQLNGWIDLAAGEAAHRRELRKSFRSLINWGRANMELRYVNAADPDRDAFDALQRFHFKMAGHATRSQASWDAMFAWVAGGGGELMLARLPDGELVAATLVVFGKTEAYYATGVYDRERFDKPLAHWPIWNAVGRAREKGLYRFDLGIIPHSGMASAKEEAIGYFKRGLAMSIVASTEWNWGARVKRESA